MSLFLLGHATTPDKLKLTHSVTSDVDTYVSYIDYSDANPPVVQEMNKEAHTFTTAGTNDILAGVTDAAQRRVVKQISIINVHASIATNVSVILDAIDGSDYQIAETVTLQPGEAFKYEEGLGWFKTATTTAPLANSTNKSTASQAFSTTDAYVTGSNVRIDALGTPVIGLLYDCSFDMVKTAGTGAMVVIVRVGTAGTTADTARLTFTMDAGTSAADTATFVVRAMFRAVGASAVLQGRITMANSGPTATGFRDGSPTLGIQQVTSGTFDSGVANSQIGISFNGQTAFSGTAQLVEAEMVKR
jgi:hypothetical protein